MWRASLAVVAVVACGDNAPGILTPEQAATQPAGTKVTVVGTVHTVTWDSTQTATRKRELAAHAGDLEWILEQDAEEERGQHHAYDDVGAKYPRTTDHYVLIRSTVPAGITFGAADFTPGKLADAWALGIHLTEPIDPATPMPDVGTMVKVTGTVQRIAWNQRDLKVPIIEPTQLDVIIGPPAGSPPGATCSLDQQCNARLVCDRATRTCKPPPREIYWADPLHDVNGACDVDDDCPLGQVCDAGYAMVATGQFKVNYFPSTDVGRHVCRLVPGATVASQCPRIYTTRDLAGARFVTGKEICVRATLLVATQATDGDTHDQMQVDEPIPYPTDDIPYHLFGATTENGPPYKDPSAPAGAIPDPQVGQEVIAVGTYRYDPDHGWHEVHPVKAYFTP